MSNKNEDKSKEKLKELKDFSVSMDNKKETRCDQTPLEHAIMELIAAKDFDGYLLTHFDCKMVKEVVGAPVQTAALMFSNGRFFIRFVEEFFNKLTTDERVAVVKHEIAHFVMKHFARRNGRDPQLFNIAADLSINQMIAHLPEESVTLPDGWTPNESMEYYYDKYLDKIEKANAQGKNAPSDMPGQFDVVMDSPNSASESESMSEEIIRETVKEQIDSGVSLDKLRGLHAGSLEEYIDELTKPAIINWKHALTRFAATLADQVSRRTLKRPDKRDLYPWGRKREYLPSLVICIDSSGSVSNAMLATFFSQVNLLGKMLSEINVVIADAQVHEHFIYKRGLEEKLRSSAAGRGGTDFDPAICYINKNLSQCDGAIYLTDGYCPVPDTRCKIPMIWVVTQNTSFEGTPKINAPLDE